LADSAQELSGDEVIRSSFRSWQIFQLIWRRQLRTFAIEFSILKAPGEHRGFFMPQQNLLLRGSGLRMIRAPNYRELLANTNSNERKYYKQLDGAGSRSLEAWILLAKQGVVSDRIGSRHRGGQGTGQS
jgi:hypothetical protein